MPKTTPLTMSVECIKGFIEEKIANGELKAEDCEGMTVKTAGTVLPNPKNNQYYRLKDENLVLYLTAKKDVCDDAIRESLIKNLGKVCTVTGKLTFNSLDEKIYCNLIPDGKVEPLAEHNGLISFLMRRLGDSVVHKRRVPPTEIKKVVLIHGKPDDHGRYYAREDVFGRLNEKHIPKDTIVCKEIAISNPSQIVGAIKEVCEDQNVNVLAIARGGTEGSLSAFNDIEVLRALADTDERIYRILGIGHTSSRPMAYLFADGDADTPSEVGRHIAGLWDKKTNLTSSFKPFYSSSAVL